MESNNNYLGTQDIERQATGGNGSENAADLFEKELHAPAKTAVDTPHTGRMPGDDIEDIGEMPEAEQPAMFRDIADEIKNGGAPPKPEQPMPGPKPAEVQDFKKEFYKRVLNYATTQGWALYADVDDAEIFAITEEEFKMLDPWISSLVARYGGAIPIEIEGLIAFGIMQAIRFKTASKLRKTNKANEQLRGSTQVRQTMAAAATAQAGTKRRNWKVDKEGYYERDAVDNSYIAKADRRERASLADIAELVQYNSNATLQKAFNVEDITKVPGYVNPHENED